MADLLHGRGGGGALLANMVERVAGSRWAVCLDIICSPYHDLLDLFFSDTFLIRIEGVSCA
jgi:hypothetical protein